MGRFSRVSCCERSPSSTRTESQHHSQVFVEYYDSRVRCSRQRLEAAMI
jgi:hypothetical protein